MSAIDADELLEGLRAAGHRVFELGRFTDTDGAAAFLTVSPRTLRAWRAAGTGPPDHHPGRIVLYPLGELIEYVESTRVAAEQ